MAKTYPPGMIVKSVHAKGGAIRDYAAKAAPKKAAPTDPFAPMSPQDINATINRYTGMYGNPRTDAQIQSSAQSQIDPIIAALTKSANDRAAASTQAIKGLTDSYAGELGKINWGAPYQRAEEQQAAVDSALQQQLAGAGASLGSDLKSRLQAIGDPAVATAGNDLASRGAATGTTEFARGSNALTSLIAQAAAAGSYGQKLPGIAKLSGLQGVSQANSQAANDIATGTQNALGQLPSIVNALRSENTNIRGNKASAATNLFTTLTGQNVTKATAKAGLQNTSFDNGLAAQNAQTDAEYKAAQLAISQQNADASTLRAKKAAAKTSKNGLSASKQADIARIAAKDAEDLYHGISHTNSQGESITDSYSVPYQEAIKTLIARYPTYSRQQILKMVNRWYPAGGKFPDGTPNGRPAPKAKPLSPKQQAATNAALNPVATLVGQ